MLRGGFRCGWLCGGRGFGGWRGGGSVCGRFFARCAHVTNRRADGDHVAWPGQQIQHRAFDRRFDLNGGLVGFDLGDHVAFFDRLADLNRPVDQCPFGHVEAQLGHDNRFSHYTSSFTASIIFCGLGSAAISRSRE